MGYRRVMDKETSGHTTIWVVSAKFMCEPVDIEPHGLTDFDREVDALRADAVGEEADDGGRAAARDRGDPEADYHRLGYYQRWTRSITDNLLRRGVLTEAELRAALEAP